jgi:hypothetical protein
MQVESYSDSGIRIRGSVFRKINIIDSATFGFGSFLHPGGFYNNGDSLSWIWGSADQINTPDSLIIFISYRGHKVK